MNQPVVLTTRTLLVFLVAVVILCGGVAVAVAQLGQPGSAGAQGYASGETRALKKLNRALTKANRTLTGIQNAIGSDLDSPGTSLRRNTKDTADNVQKLCRAVAEFQSSC